MTERRFIPVGSPKKAKKSDRTGSQHNKLVGEANEFINEAMSDRQLYPYVVEAVSEIDWSIYGCIVTVRMISKDGVTVRVRPAPRAFNDVLDAIIEYIDKPEADDLTASHEGGTTYLIYKL